MSEDTTELDLNNSISVTLDSKNQVKPTVKLRFTNPTDAELYARAVVTISKLILEIWNLPGDYSSLGKLWIIIQEQIESQRKEVTE